jgi:hypothetical protein
MRKMFPIEPAKGVHLDAIGKMLYTPRKHLKTVRLPLNWQLVKMESDDEYRERMRKIFSSTFTEGVQTSEFDANTRD